MNLITVLSVLGVIGGNLIALVGVLYLDWNLVTVFSLHWLETLAIVTVNIPKIRRAEGQPLARDMRWTVRSGNCVQMGFRGEVANFLSLGGFVMILSVGLGFVLLGVGESRVAARVARVLWQRPPLPFTGLEGHGGELLLGFVLFLGSETVAYRRVFLGQQVYRQVTRRQQIDGPLQRILGILAFLLLVLFVGLRTHRFELALTGAVLFKIAVEIMTLLHPGRFAWVTPGRDAKGEGGTE